MKSARSAQGPTGGLIREVQRLFSSGAAGLMSDAELLDQVVSRRDEASEAAFEELVTRHGPMVLRVCRGILLNAHDAEDAFQAVFLVLANRARSIRRSGSVASWLFGVAQRVAVRGKQRAARQRALDRLAAERTSETQLPTDDEHDWSILHDEINRLPGSLRAPIVLCYLEGLTYAAAARQLGVSEKAIRGRLARARKRLHQRLSRRGVTVPAGLLAAGAAGHAQAAIPIPLVHSTVRIALGFVAGNAAAALARGVLNAMLLNQLKAATVVLCLGVGGGYSTWQAVATAGGGQGQKATAPVVAKKPRPIQKPTTDRYGDPLPPGAVMRLGTVRYRQAQGIRHIVYSPDGQLVVTDSGQYRFVVRDARDGKTLRQVDLGVEILEDLVFSPDGKTIATVGFTFEPKRNVVVNHLVLVDPATGRVVRRAEWDDQSSVARVAFLPDGKTIATASMDSTLRLWDVATTKLLRQERLAGNAKLSPESIAFSPGAASRLLAVYKPGTIDLWEVANLRHARSIAIGGQYRPSGLVFSPDGKILATGVASRGEEIRLWRVSAGTLLGHFKSRKNIHVNHMAFSPDGKVLVAVGGEDSPVFFDTATGEELDSLRKKLSSDQGIALITDSFSMDRPLTFSPDGRTLAATGSSQTLHFWDLKTGKDRLATPEAHLGEVTALACLPDSKTLVSGSRDRTARLWDLETGRPMRMFRQENWVDSLAVSADGSLLATGSVFPTWTEIYIWDLRTGERRRVWRVERGKDGALITILRGLAFGKDNSSVTAAIGDGSLRRWDVSTGKEQPVAQPKLEQPPRERMIGLDIVDRAVFSRDGRSVAMIGGGWVQIMDVASGDRRFKETSGAGWAREACVFSPSGGSLAIVREARKAFQAGSWGGSRVTASTIVWLDSESGSVRRQITIPESGVLALAFSPDGKAIAAGTYLETSRRGIIRIFRLRDKREIQSIESPCPWIEALCFTPDGKQIIAGMQDTSLVIWDVRPGR